MRWLVFWAVIVGMDAAAVDWVVKSKAYTREVIHMIDIRTGPGTYNDMYDGSRVTIIYNPVTKKTISRTVVPPTTIGLCRVWWPAVAASFETLLALVIALTRTGQWLIAEMPMPQMNTRKWLFAVAVLATELGLVITPMKNSGVDPMNAQWTPIIIYLIVLHAIAFIPVWIVLLYRLVQLRRNWSDPETVMDRW